MAKKQIKTKSIEESLWESANKLRGSVEPSEYKHVVLSLIFLKYADDRFAERRRELIAEGKDAFVGNAAFYNAKNVFFLGDSSRWSFIMENAKQSDVAVKIDAALAAIEKVPPSKARSRTTTIPGSGSTAPSSPRCSTKSTKSTRLRTANTTSSGAFTNIFSPSSPSPRARKKANFTRRRAS